MRSRALIVLMVMTALFFGGCAVSDPPADSQPTVLSHFFPLTNGLIYSYSRFDKTLNENDTLRCRLLVGQTKLDPDLLINTKTGDTVYHIGFTKDANGNQAAFMQNGDTTIYVLSGQLVPGARWVADIDHGIYATDTAHYDDYYLRDRQTHFPDVVVVEYQQTNHPDIHTLRFFARDHGLIREVSLYGDGTEISSLQLISIESPH
jgi:hypothetical protein